ncbi:hypothetical protein EYF80_038733 [Liparis tanakae]|uniref:Uncharacterized protein n=1 Tax=Liparis tanakae TaxID=230148 RepID=A0A4Z2GEE8_9TELE|nr:hypothetical protein EYF80_038733 [Liparis tanakae]
MSIPDAICCTPASSEYTEASGERLRGRRALEAKGRVCFSQRFLTGAPDPEIPGPNVPAERLKQGKEVFLRRNQGGKLCVEGNL